MELPDGELGVRRFRINQELSRRLHRINGAGHNQHAGSVIKHQDGLKLVRGIERARAFQDIRALAGDRHAVLHAHHLQLARRHHHRGAGGGVGPVPEREGKVQQVGLGPRGGDVSNGQSADGGRADIQHQVGRAGAPRVDRPDRDRERAGIQRRAGNSPAVGIDRQPEREPRGPKQGRRLSRPNRVSEAALILGPGGGRGTGDHRHGGSDRQREDLAVGVNQIGRADGDQERAADDRRPGDDPGGRVKAQASRQISGSKGNGRRARRGSRETKEHPLLPAGI